MSQPDGTVGSRSWEDTAPMAETAFTITYDGPDLRSGRMPVRHLAPALLALGEVFTEASLTIHPDRPPVSLDIHATATGSFEVGLIVASPETWDHAVDLLTSDPATAIVQLKEVVVGAGVGLFWLVKWMRKRRVQNVDTTPDPGQVRVVLDDGATIEVPTQTWALSQSISIRRHMTEAVAPIRTDGVDRILIRSNSEKIELATSDIDAFELPAEPMLQPLIDDTSDMAVSVVSPNFSDGKWKVSDGESTFWATISDADFLQRINDGEPFRKGDLLVCRMRVVQTQTSEGLRTIWDIEHVHSHRPPPQHLTFPLDPD